MSKSRLSSDFIWLAILCLVIILPYYKIIGQEKGIMLGSYSSDLSNFFAPLITLGFDSLSKGKLPLWNPYIFSGVPFLAESQLGIFYPPNLLHLFLPLSFSLNLLIILHQCLAGIFMFLYIKRISQDCFSSFVGASVFALSSIFITRIFAGHLTVLYAISWIPLLFLLVDKYIPKKSYILAVLTGFVLCLQLLAGHIQFVFISLLALFLYGSCLKYLQNDKYSVKDYLQFFSLFFVSLVFGIGLSSIQLLPLMELLKESIRLKDPLFRFCFSMPPENLITLLTPGFFGWISNALWWGKWFPWESTLYVGVLPILLSFFAIIKGGKYAKFFAFLLLFSWVLSIGVYLPIFKCVFNYLPAFNLFRANGRFLTLTAFSFSVLTAFGCRGLKNYYNDKGIDRKLIFTIIFGLVLLFILIGLKFILSQLWKKFFYFVISYDKLATETGFNFGQGFNPLQAKEITISELNKSIIILLEAIVILIFYASRLLKERIMKFLIAAFIIFDLLSFGGNYLSGFSLKDSYLDNKTVDFLKSNIGQSRYLAMRTLIWNPGIMNRIPSIGGYSGVVPRRYNEFLNFTQERPLDGAIALDAITKLSKLFELVNLKFVLVNKEYVTFAAPHFKHVFSNGNIDIYQAATTLPKAFIVHKAKFILKRDDILDALLDGSFDFKDEVILEENFKLIKLENPSKLIEQEPKIITYLPERVVVKADSKSDGYMILCDNYYPGWKAYLDGKKIPILKADYILRAVFLPAGSHTIEFIYAPASLKLGFAITVLFLILSLAICLIHIFKKKS